MQVLCNNLTWDQAKQHCEGLGYHLARIMNRKRNTGRVENSFQKLDTSSTSALLARESAKFRQTK